MARFAWTTVTPGGGARQLPPTWGRGAGQRGVHFERVAGLWLPLHTQFLRLPKQQIIQLRYAGCGSPCAMLPSEDHFPPSLHVQLERTSRRTQPAPPFLPLDAQPRMSCFFHILLRQMPLPQLIVLLEVPAASSVLIRMNPTSLVLCLRQPPSDESCQVATWCGDPTKLF